MGEPIPPLRPPPNHARTARSASSSCGPRSSESRGRGRSPPRCRRDRRTWKMRAPAALPRARGSCGGGKTETRRACCSALSYDRSSPSGCPPYERHGLSARDADCPTTLRVPGRRVTAARGRAGAEPNVSAGLRQIRPSSVGAHARRRKWRGWCWRRCEERAASKRGSLSNRSGDEFPGVRQRQWGPAVRGGGQDDRSRLSHPNIVPVYEPWRGAGDVLPRDGARRGGHRRGSS